MMEEDRQESGRAQGGTHPAFVPPRRNSTRFRDGKLIVSSAARIQVYRAAPPQSWTKTKENPVWRPDLGGDFNFRCAMKWVQHYRSERGRKAGLADEPPRNRRLEAIGQFLETIPNELRAELRRYLASSWLVYSLLYRCPGAMELAETNRGLAFGLANLRLFGLRRTERPLRTARSLLRKPRRGIAGYLGFPGREASVRILSRVVPAALDVRKFFYLREAMNDVAFERMLHLPRINAAVIMLLTRQELAPFLSHGLLHDAGMERSWDRLGFHVAGLLRDTVAMLRSAGRNPPAFRSLRDLEEVHQDLAERWTHATFEDVSFGEPPIPGTQSIVPLRSSGELVTEARQMRNCLASPQWARDCSHGRLYIYRMIEPVRCSLALGRSWSGTWRVVEFRTARNGSPSRSAWDAVMAWLAGEQGTTGLVTGPDQGEADTWKEAGKDGDDDLPS